MSEPDVAGDPLTPGAGFQGDDYSREYVFMNLVGKSKSGKTAIWSVRNKKSGDLLGTVKWFGRWRQYTFFPEPECVFSAGCMDDISDFVRSRRHG